MLVKELYLNGLTAFMADSDHWTLFKPMNLPKCLILESFIESLAIFTYIFMIIKLIFSKLVRIHLFFLCGLGRTGLFVN
jgi:hypothetical protein